MPKPKLGRPPKVHKENYSESLQNICIRYISEKVSLKALTVDPEINTDNLTYGYLRVLSSQHKWAALREHYEERGWCRLPDGTMFKSKPKAERNPIKEAEEKVISTEIKLSEITRELDQVRNDILDAKQTIIRQVKAAIAIQMGNGLLLKKLNVMVKNLSDEKLARLSPMELGKLMATVAKSIAIGGEMERRALGIDQQPVLLQQNSITYGDDIKSLPTEELIKIVEAEVDNG